MNSIIRKQVSARRLLSGIALVSIALCALIATGPARAGCQCGIAGPHHHFVNQGYVPGPGDLSNPEMGGYWYWMRSPEQERRVVMGLYNRYCIRCHGVDGRGIWDIPCVPDFTNLAWQASRPDPYRTRVILEGRGAVMPAFRGTLTLEEACAMARYLHTFVPGAEISRPNLAPNAPPAVRPPTGTNSARPAPAPLPADSPGPFSRAPQPRT
jgi:mono/diheme cytochrome c family protein